MIRDCDAGSNQLTSDTVIMSINEQHAYQGANNLLFNAVKVQPGQRLLIVGEHGNNTHFDRDVCDIVLTAAIAARIDAQVMTFEVCNSADDFPQSLSDTMASVDHTVFFSRLGDQVRFCPTPGTGSKTMCYALNAGYLASDFCRTPHTLNQRLHDRLMNKISSSSRFDISCSSGTELTGKLAVRADDCLSDDAFTAFEVNLFPKTIFPPVSCSNMSGKLVMKDWLTSSSTVIYDGSVYPLKEPVIATIENGTILRFDGNEKQCAELENHFNRVSGIVGGEAMAINSWHTGIIPSTWYDRRARDDLERWGSVSYASPRITHFHACGSDPGHIGINLLDASIQFDGDMIFRNGHFLYPHSDQCADIVSDYTSWYHVFDQNADIGLMT